ncbi:ROK family transcriptional regulator [Dictyobacter aurantiacus]|uniref:Xylose repressor protein n=1 Tax=Dictyobacter aurantiacus TaxID=1936993 RepID=A0A401ZSU4_9CHLR|nr:ROK family transcriptional regulator [Dictyobacter aurantiacus]GCE09988.1 xylose repressor protein [Dictyobacter aurantiacus]
MAPTRTGSKRLLRDLNQNIVFNLLVEHGTLSRTELARRSRLPAATITRICGEFLTAGLVTEIASEESSGGRRPILLSINPEAGYVIGVKLRQESATIALCDLSCALKHTCEIQFSAGAAPHHVVDVITGAIKRCASEGGIALNQVIGVGVGLSGLIDSQYGLCRYSAILGWQDVELGPALEFKLHLPVRVDNDVNTLAVAERYFGAGRDAANFLLITIGRGVGLGIVIRGEIYRGGRGGAGEFGHTTADTSPGAPLCECGKRGCLEALVSDIGLLQAAEIHIQDGYDETRLMGLIQQARAGDKKLQAVFNRAGNALGIAVANMVNIFDPDRVILNGEGLRAGELLLKPMYATLPAHIFGPARQPDFVVGSIDETIWARGAASLILHEMFQAPIYEEDEETLAIDHLLTQATRASHRKKRKEG